MKSWAAPCGMARLLSGAPAGADGLLAAPCVQMADHGDVRVVPDMQTIAWIAACDIQA